MLNSSFRKNQRLKMAKVSGEELFSFTPFYSRSRSFSVFVNFPLFAIFIVIECIYSIGNNIYTKMSRNKDKYDNANRRQQIFMSPEDVAAGKKTNWTAIEITGKHLSAVNSLEY